MNKLLCASLAWQEGGSVRGSSGSGLEETFDDHQRYDMMREGERSGKI